jgi:glycosyltransferase involved in cell wall biosynthesis
MITGLGSSRDLASGKQGAFYQTLEEFHKYWDRIDIVCPRIRGQKGKVLFVNVHIHVSPWPLFLHPIYFIWKSVRLHREQQFSLMTVQEFPPFYNGIGAWLISKMTRVPYVLEIMHIPGYPKASSLKERIYKWLAYAFLDFDVAGARAVRVINKSETLTFLENAGIAAKKMRYIPANYIDMEVYQPQAGPKKYDLIVVGRLEKNKGIDLFLETIKELGCSALIVGSGSLSKDISLKIKNLKLNIDMHGWAEDSSEIARLLNQSKALIMCSYNEGGPRVVLEAMACGVPVLATPVGIVPDVVKAGKTGYIIDWNARDIARKARLLFSHYAELAKQCVEMARPFEKKTAIKFYAEELKKLI